MGPSPELCHGKWNKRREQMLCHALIWAALRLAGVRVAAAVAVKPTGGASVNPVSTDPNSTPLQQQCQGNARRRRQACGVTSAANSH